MVVDSPAVIAILKNEPSANLLREAVLGSERCLMPAPGMVESSIVIEAQRGSAGVREFDALLHELAIEIVPFDFEQALIAREAFRRFGKGRHPAGLNFGDCLAYALAKLLAEPLLFIGEDFAKTDIAAAQARDG
jgi:ribonuclease VapC